MTGYGIAKKVAIALQDIDLIDEGIEQRTAEWFRARLNAVRDCLQSIDLKQGGTNPHLPYLEKAILELQDLLDVRYTKAGLEGAIKKLLRIRRDMIEGRPPGTYYYFAVSLDFTLVPVGWFNGEKQARQYIKDNTPDLQYTVLVTSQTVREWMDMWSVTATREDL